MNECTPPVSREEAAAARLSPSLAALRHAQLYAAPLSLLRLSLPYDQQERGGSRRLRVGACVERHPARPRRGEGGVTVRG